MVRTVVTWAKLSAAFADFTFLAVTRALAVAVAACHQAFRAFFAVCHLIPLCSFFRGRFGLRISPSEPLFLVVDVGADEIVV
jgi:hypothetical protein